MINTKKPTQILKEEHKEVLQKLDALEEIFAKLDSKQEVAERLKELAGFFAVDFWLHFAKEEEALFPEIEKFIPRDGGPTGMMLIEHEDLRNTNARIQEAVSQYLSGSDAPETREVIRKKGIYFIALLREHITKEDNILFMMADMHMDGNQAEKVLKLFGEIEKR
ncbi:MAG: hemerythrin domain-containing protein [Chloroflexi bacterium]|nr:hemerythrin domain-containing protein [Chloroflexota bacterium]